MKWGARRERPIPDAPRRCSTQRPSAAFPDSIAIRLMLANAHDLNGNAAAALDAFDCVLAAKPAHVDPRLGRLTNLSYLSRVDEAIAAATAIIDTGTWNVGDAYYWRAWNRYQARQLDEAWADVRQAMSLVSNTAVRARGIHCDARKDLDTSIAHFNRAFEIDPANCLAVWSAGLVHNDRADWPAAAGTFAKAAACFTTAAATARKELAGLEKAALAPAVRRNAAWRAPASASNPPRICASRRPSTPGAGITSGRPSGSPLPHPGRLISCAGTENTSGRKGGRW